MISRPRRKRLRPRRSSEGGPWIQIDTTGEHGSVALIDRRGAVVARQTFPLDPPSPGALLRAMVVLCGQLFPERAKRVEGRPSTSSGHIRNVVNGIDVVPGPGRFSRVRLGVVTANALAWALRIPLVVRGKRVRVATPEYGAEPSISYQLPATSRKRPNGR